MISGAPDDYEVGYGRPPKATQFQPGQSGNRKGRPKGSRNISIMLNEELAANVTVTLDGRRVKRTKGQIMVRQVVDKAAKGDLNAAKLILKLQSEAKSLPTPVITPNSPAAFQKVDTELTDEQCTDILRSIARDFGERSQ